MDINVLDSTSLNNKLSSWYECLYRESIMSLKNWIPAFAGMTALLILSMSSSYAAEKNRWVFNDVSFEYPFDGGGMLMYSRMWRLGRSLEVGGVLGGGVIQQKWTDQKTALGDLDIRNTTVVLPFVGPQITFDLQYLLLSLSYGVYWGNVDTRVKTSGGDLTGTKRAWGSGVYSPLLSLDFYHEKANMIFGFGLGGFWGTSFPDYTASGAAGSVTIRDNPLNTLTFHIHTRWAGHGRAPLPPKKEDNDFE